MRRTLWAALSRVERLAVDAQRQAGTVDPAQLVAILLEGRQQAARGDQPRRTPEARLARRRELRAMLAAQRHAG